jgi:hypothetical protein
MTRNATRAATHLPAAMRTLGAGVCPPGRGRRRRCVGQVDGSNRSGLDKDLRTLFGERDAAIRVLVLKDEFESLGVVCGVSTLGARA